MKKILKAKRGQFLVIAAFLVVIILTTTMITVYNGVQYNPFTEPATLANMITEINSSIKRILGFTVGYYGSILQVTGNYSYAQEKINNYIYSGITNVAHSHIEWSPSFEIDDLKIATKWFEPVSWSLGNISLTYSLPNQGLEGIQYTTSCLLLVDMKDTVNGHSIVNIRKEGNFPNLWLTKENFFFYSYDYDTLKWKLIPLENDPMVSIDGNYSLKIPSSVNPTAYFIKVVDDRGIMASAYYTPTRKSEYSYSFSWNNTLYQSLNTDTIVVELLQNGTLRWLNENLFMNGGERPIPPFPIHAIHVNQTVNSVNAEVPFQIEDWGSNYMVPLGLSTNSSIFNSRSMIVFLLNHSVSKTTVWWDGRDIATQTPYAWTNKYFTNDDPDNDILTNGELTLDLSNNKRISATVNTVTSYVEFLRINGRTPIYGSDLSYTIHHGIVRDIIQQEAEWSGGITDCPNIYAHIVATLPAKTNYYTFSVRTIFLSSDKNRDITELSTIQLYADRGQAITEDGIAASKPIPSTSPPNMFYDGGSAWSHHWSEFIDANNNGAGIMFRNVTNKNLYAFDDMAGNKTGAIEIFTSSQKIEFNPIARYSIDDFQDAYDIAWHGAIVTMGSGLPTETIFPYEVSYIYNEADLYLGLWILVEHPPTVTVT